MIELPTVTLVCADGVNAQRAEKVLDRCKSFCNFGAIKLLTHLQTDYQHRVEIMNLDSLIKYSIFILKELYKYINTEHLLIVQRDGYILNPHTWNPDWLNYDYISPVFNDLNIVGAGGFSLRTNKLMKRVSEKLPDWDGIETEKYQRNLGYYEDGVISIAMRKDLESEGYKFAPLEQGAMFSAGGNPNFYYPYPFGFHGSWRQIELETGYVHEKIKHDGIIPTL